MKIEGRVGVQRGVDDALNPPRIGNQGEIIVSDMNGMFYEQTMRGNGFVYSTSTAASVVALGTAAAPNIWNPSGSGRNLVIHKICFGAAAVGTPVVSNIQYGILSNAGSQVGTAAPVVSLTAVAGVNLLLGSGIASAMRFAPATISLTAAPTYFATSGCWTGSAAAPTTGMNFFDDVNGRIIVPPGNLFQIGASTATSTTFVISIYALELPIPLTA